MRTRRNRQLFLAAALFPACAALAQVPPSITGLNPATVRTGSPSFTMTISGTLLNDTQFGPVFVEWNGATQLQPFSAIGPRLSVIVPAQLVASAGIVSLRVGRPEPFGNQIRNVFSNTVSFSITQPGSTTMVVSPLSISLTVTLFSGVPTFPQAPTISIGATGSAIGFGAGASLTSPAPANWLGIAANNGTTPFGLRPQINPTGLPRGFYTGQIVVSPSGGSSQGGDQVVNVQLTVVGAALLSSPDQVTFVHQIGGSPPPPQTLTIASVGAASRAFISNPSVATPPSTFWLRIDPLNGNAPGNIQVSVDPAGLAEGPYIAALTLIPTTATNDTLQIPIVLLVIAAPNRTLSFTHSPPGNAPAPQTFTLAGEGGELNFSCKATSDDGWLRAQPETGTTPATITVSVVPGDLAAGTYSGTVNCVQREDATIAYVVGVNLTVRQGTRVISHIADGAGWKTTIVLVNTGTTPASFTLNFWRSSGSPLPVSVAGRGAVSTISDTIPGAGSRTIESTGTSVDLGVGWAELTGDSSIGGTAIFREQNLRQEAAVPILSSGATRLQIPFDNGPNLALGVALANSASSTANVSVVIRNESGQTISNEPSLSLASRGHTSFVQPSRSTRPEDRRGTVELTSPAPFFALGIRSNEGAFTSVESLPEQQPRSKTISHIADGGGWKTTIVLVNTGNVAAQFTLNFWGSDGRALPISLIGRSASSSVTGAIPAGGSQTLETDGSATGLSQGWAELVTSQAAGGVAIFREQNLRQEAAVPIISTGGTRLLLPFDNGPGLSLGVALANTNATSDAVITIRFRNEQGQLISTDPSITLLRRGHTAFVLPVRSTRPEDQRGVVEFTSTVEIFGLGIRGNAGAFTSVRTVQ